MRNAALYVLYIREIAVLYGGGAAALPKADWKSDPEASAILGTALQIGKHRGVTTIPVYVNAPNAASIIVDMAATLGVDYLMLGASHRGSMSQLLRGNVATEVAGSLPDNIQLVSTDSRNDFSIFFCLVAIALTMARNEARRS